MQYNAFLGSPRVDKITRLMSLLLVEDGVDGDSGFSGLSITDDEFSLSSSDGDQTVDGFKTGLHGFVDGLSGNDTGSLNFNSISILGFDCSVAVDGVSEGVEDATQHFFSDRDIDNGAGSSYYITFLNFSIVSEDDDTDVIGFKVERHTSDSRGEFDHFSGLHFLETENSGDTISDGNDGTVFFNIVLLGNLGNFLF
jgi:hypothetical protein